VEREPDWHQGIVLDVNAAFVAIMSSDLIRPPTHR
jgi:hypothetical protein